MNQDSSRPDDSFRVPFWLRIAAAVVLAPVMILGAAWILSGGFGLMLGIPIFLAGAAPFIVVLRAHRLQRLHPAALMIVAAVIEIWFGVMLLGDSFPGDREFGQATIALGVLTLLIAGAIVLASVHNRQANDLDKGAGRRSVPRPPTVPTAESSEFDGTQRPGGRL